MGWRCIARRQEWPQWILRCQVKRAGPNAQGVHESRLLGRNNTAAFARRLAQNITRPRRTKFAELKPASVAPLKDWTTRAKIKWILQPVMLRHDVFTKEIRRLLHGGNVFIVAGMVMPR